MNNYNTSPSKIILDTGAKRILSVQSLLIVGVTWGFYFYTGLLAAQSALYGGCIALFNVWMMNRRVHTAAAIAKISPGSEVRILYMAAIQRFIFTIVFFIVGLKFLELLPVPLLIAFAIAQIGYFFKGRSDDSSKTHHVYDKKP